MLSLLFVIILFLFLFQFMEGKWYATEKFGTTQSKCMTYNFGEDEDGFKYVEQHSVLSAPKNLLSLDNKFKYKGRLTAPYSANPAQMIVRFPLSKKHFLQIIYIPTNSRIAGARKCIFPGQSQKSN